MTLQSSQSTPGLCFIPCCFTMGSGLWVAIRASLMPFVSFEIFPLTSFSLG